MADSPTIIMLRVCDTAISYSTTKPKICRSSHSYPINSFHLYISIQILLTALSTFPKVLTGRMCLTIGSFLNWCRIISVILMTFTLDSRVML